MAATARYLTGGLVTGGISTAYTAPSGTAVTILYANLGTHSQSGTAGGPWSVMILHGPTGAPSTWLPLTGVSARRSLICRAPVTLPSAIGAIVISASTSHVFTLYLNGLEH